MLRATLLLATALLLTSGCLLPDTPLFDIVDDEDNGNSPSSPHRSSRSPELPAEPFSYDIELPDHYKQPALDDGPAAVSALEHDTTPADNPITDEGATLGRVLFYDTKLSANGTTACASCHFQEVGFGDNARRSVGFDGGRTGRHSMSLTNARFYAGGRFFWDERADTLEEQVLMPFQDPIEMGLTLPEVERLVSEQPYYESLFIDAFGDPAINADRISRALAQFIRSMVSVDSRYDQARAAVDRPLEPFPDFSAEENLGKRLFFAPGDGRFPCAGCHASEAFIGVAPGRTDTGATNNGIDSGIADDDGRFGVTREFEDLGRFKVPSLRNVEVTGPYMHDGRFDTLDQVVRHYSDRMSQHPNLDPALQGDLGLPLRYNFTAREEAAVVAFLETLTDDGFLTDEKFSDPFE